MLGNFRWEGYDEPMLKINRLLGKRGDSDGDDASGDPFPNRNGPTGRTQLGKYQGESWSISTLAQLDILQYNVSGVTLA